MDLLQACLLALVQGITEFLPISSSAHLILVPRFLGWPDQGLAFDVAVHLGTLLAVVAYFRRELTEIIAAWLASVFGRAPQNANSRLGWALLLATLPLIVAGPLLSDLVETRLRSPLVIAFTTAFFGIMLWVADRRPDRVSSESGINLRMALIIGLAQVLALVPGTSRSGITITAGLALGLDRTTAARFSFLLSIPAIAGASVFELRELVTSALPVDWVFLLSGLIISALSAWLCIKAFIAFVERIGMLPFVWYRLGLAALLVYAFL